MILSDILLVAVIGGLFSLLVASRAARYAKLSEFEKWYRDERLKAFVQFVLKMTEAKHKVEKELINSDGNLQLQQEVVISAIKVIDGYDRIASLFMTDAQAIKFEALLGALSESAEENLRCNMRLEKIRSLMLDIELFLKNIISKSGGELESYSR